MAKGCKKCAEVECEECPEWIFTLADLIMCMMGLFVILWVLKPVGNPATGNSDDMKKEYIKMSAAIRDAFGYVPNPSSQDPVDMLLIQQKLRGEKVPVGPGEGGKTQLDNKGTEGEDPQVTKIRDGTQSSIGAAFVFEAGSAVPTADVMKKVKQMAQTISGHRQIVIVKGHASLDDFGDAGGTERQARELSMARAEAIADVLIAEGVSAEVIRVQGCSTWEPVAQRRFSPQAQAINRRAEVEVTNQLVEERQDKKRTVAPGPSVRPGN